MKSCLCVISSKNPTNILIDTVNGIKLYYPEFDIVIIDSNSTNTEYYKRLLSQHEDVKIEFCKNLNWELGAWYYAFHKYNNYNVYMFIQDGLTPVCRVPNLNTYNFPDKTLYSFHYTARISDDFDLFGILTEIYRDTNMSCISELDPNTMITGTAHTSFITNRENVNTILKLEDAYIMKNLQKSKIDSWLSERCGGFAADRNNNARIDITPYFKKTSLGRY
jgi:hypothetical protein